MQQPHALERGCSTGEVTQPGSAQKPYLLRSQHSYVVLSSPERDCLITRTRTVSHIAQWYRLLERLEAENAQLRRNVVDLVLEIQVSRDSVR